MGFGKKKVRETEASKEASKTEGRFTPSTDEDLKRYRKAGKRARRERSEGRAERKEKKKGKHDFPILRGAALREALTEGKKFRIFRDNFISSFEEEIKRFDLGKLPRYREYLKPKKADAEFIIDIISLMSKMTWTQLSILIHAGVTSGERPIGLVTRSWSEAFQFAQNALFIALGVDVGDGTYRLTDRDVLEYWPVSNRKRPSKEDRMLNEARARDDDDDDDDADEDDEDEEETSSSKKGKASKAKSKAKSRDDDDDDDDEDDEDEDEDEDEDDEDEKPSKKKKSKKSSKSKDDDDDDDADDEDDDDDEDDEDDKPSKKSKKSKTPKRDYDDEDEDEDDKPKGKGGKVKKSKKKDKKSDKKEKSDKKVDITDKSTVSRVGKRDKGGRKTELLEMIPKGGIKVKALMAEAKEAGFKVSKVSAWLKGFVRYGYIKVS